MLRSDAQVAMEQAHRELRTASATHADAATIVEDEPLRSRFEELAHERRSMADDLAAHIRAAGELPDEPDPDRNALRTAARHLRAALSNDDPLAVVRDCEKTEDELARTLNAARHADVPASTGTLLDRHLEAVDRARLLLSRARIAITDG